MEEMIVLEVLERSGKVRERVRLHSYPVQLGRAYDNDIILDDECVSPHHLRIERNAQGVLCVTDLQSENGLYQIPSLRRVDAIALENENQLLVGNTHIRLRSSDFAVAPTVMANRRRASAQNRLASWPVLLPLVLAVASLILLEKYSLTFQKIKYQEMALDTLSPMLGLLVWAGIWAFIGRILGHRAAYLAHANMVLLAMLALFGLDYFIEYYSFGFSAETSASVIQSLAVTLIGGSLLFGHLHYATQLRRKTVAWSSGLFAVGALGIVMFSNHVRDSEFNSNLEFPGVILPSSRIVGQPLAPEAFFTRAQAMQAGLDKARTADN
ncbi:MAG TPA: FHA domain-containing protein [Gallionellaceae bacterium]|nr:FHA domain-containing protein [Gallionellaceae bacterium]